MKRSQLKRKTPLRLSRKRKPSERAERWSFQSGQRECQHQSCEGGHERLEQHHVVYEQHVKSYYAPSAERVMATLDPRNALTLGQSCHRAQHTRHDKVALVRLRDENYEFACELMGPTRAYEYLRRHYVGEDSRLDALLESRTSVLREG